MAGRLDGKIAIITGASRGLGQYCAVQYAKEGATVVVAARTEQVRNPALPGTIHDTARMVEEAGSEAFPVVCNVGSTDSIQAMVDAVLEKYGRIDILMNNAAVQPPGYMDTIQPRHWELEFQINVHGPFHCSRAVLPAMTEQASGNIINISSVAADRGTSHYGATKAAIEALTRGMAGDVREFGIAVNALKPVGAIDTPGVRFGRAPGQIGGDTPLPPLPPPDSYVEAAVLVAMQTVETCTGGIFNDVEVVERFADAETKRRLAEIKPV
ncbi:MAG: SDR family oxidoreductase [Dehalococcoidia bacterium]|jgi:citronellol/citronellal dehydrogenase|nr:SDR family oxidoreductase [Dehalococcoidia bacterium]